VNAVDGQDGKTVWELADEVKDASKKAAVLEVLSEHSLHAAAKAGIAERVRAFIAAGRDVNGKEGQHGMTPVHLAVLGGHDEVLKLLLAAGADANATKGKDGITPIFFKKALKLLMDAGATSIAASMLRDIHVKSKYDVSVLTI
jgi:ankyrin repeat protein